MRYIRFNRHTVFSSVLNVLGLTLALSVFLILTVLPDTDGAGDVRLEI